MVAMPTIFDDWPWHPGACPWRHRPSFGRKRKIAARPVWLVIDNVAVWLKSWRRAGLKPALALSSISCASHVGQRRTRRPLAQRAAVVVSRHSACRSLSEHVLAREGVKIKRAEAICRPARRARLSTPSSMAWRYFKLALLPATIGAM